MSRLDDLPPDQKAALSLLLRRRKTYAELATLLGIDERAVHDRAHAGLTALAPRAERSLTPQQQALIGDFLLGQTAPGREDLARRELERSESGRAWAHTLATELAELSDEPLAALQRSAAASLDGGPLPPAPAPSTPAAASSAASSVPPVATGTPARELRDRAAGLLPSSRRAGALLLAGLLALVILAVVLIPSLGGSSRSSSSTGASGTSASAAQSSSGKSGTTPSAATESKRLILRPTVPGSSALGVVEVLSESGKHAFYIAAEHLPATRGFFYAVWLYNSPTSNEAVSKSPAVGSDGRMQGGALLPADAARYHHMILTRETNDRPRRPGPIVLSGPFALH